MSSGKHAKEKIGQVSGASWFWVWSLISLASYELVMLAINQRGGALSHVIWWANDVDTGLYTWRWALVSGPLAGFLLWMVPHFLWGVGNGSHLILWVLATTAVLAVIVLAH